MKKNYSIALALAFLLSMWFQVVVAQNQKEIIIVNPDSAVVFSINYLLFPEGNATPSTFSLDFDGNQIFDLEFSASTYSGGWYAVSSIQVEGFDSTVFVVKMTDVDTLKSKNSLDTVKGQAQIPKNYCIYDTVNPLDSLKSEIRSLAWRSYDALWGHARVINDWIGTDYYLVFRKSSLYDEPWYGWVKLYVSSYSTVLIKEWGTTNKFVDVEEMVKETMIKVSPNPALERIKVEIDHCCQLTIFDINGFQVYNQHFDSGINYPVIDISVLAPGLYCVLADNGDSWVKCKFLKR